MGFEKIISDFHYSNYFQNTLSINLLNGLQNFSSNTGQLFIFINTRLYQINYLFNFILLPIIYFFSDIGFIFNLFICIFLLLSHLFYTMAIKTYFCKRLFIYFTYNCVKQNRQKQMIISVLLV